ncbi:uncharacterized protein LOC111622065 isoform X2 [Centruroides sculpturatus]|uniref:uncharacterized protein LOC111622065 isoform X2 n=1 Tax=Centruroides sculpturatus TaxID=218467 RepID=UPI000C6ED937|nr:uncharacterized protein LOC111622065 isoform X2 [Centruroides sculpturatus]
MDSKIPKFLVFWSLVTSIPYFALSYPQWKLENENTTRVSRHKRDEDEGKQGAYGRGVGFFIGEPCTDICNNILFHVYCNLTTKKCECHEEYPVNIENRKCVKVAKIGDECQYSEACTHYDEHSVCHPEGDCRCDEKYQSQFTETGNIICIPANPNGILDNSDFATLISVVAGLMIFTGLFCLVLKLFSRARFNRPRDRLGNASAPSVVMTGMDASGSSVIGSRPPSRTSGSRRPSSSSVRSQLSLRSHSSFRCHRSHRDIVRRTLSSPADSHQSPQKTISSQNSTEITKQPSPEPPDDHLNHI